MAFCERCKHWDEPDICTECSYDSLQRPNCVPTMFLPVDDVNHPEHYNVGKYECIDVMVELFGIEATQNFCELNAFKYLWRGDRKQNKSKDIEKAKWYLDKYLELESDKR